MTTTAVIPARLGSTRLAHKVLADLDGHPLLWHVWQRASRARTIQQILVATDAREVYDIVTSWGGQALMTSPDCQSGTERIASIVNQLDADLILNVQGDEPFIDPLMLDSLVDAWHAAPCDLITPVFPITSLDDLLNPNIVKVARSDSGRALYFSRSPIPHARDLPPEQWLTHFAYWGHIGVYGYRRSVLAQYPALKPSRLEQMEKLEQLRFLDAGFSFQTVETAYRSLAVDVQADLEHVRQILAQKVDNA